ncbi:phage major capsid family protein [Vibrio algicola]|uniref:Phage capsid-like C-terminal domain-containing protein n=1 Tax=Vibrio algicola TaxID=2662262 RepID=A0A5Q0TCE3_9VIBR|nr:phage major capsid protein [Vibrio algicola]
MSIQQIIKAAANAQGTIGYFAKSEVPINETGTGTNAVLIQDQLSSLITPNQPASALSLFADASVKTVDLNKTASIPISGDIDGCGFVGEGEMIPVVKGIITAKRLGAQHKLACIANATRESLDGSNGQLESFISQFVIGRSINRALEQNLLSTTTESTRNPVGLLATGSNVEVAATATNRESIFIDEIGKKLAFNQKVFIVVPPALLGFAMVALNKNLISSELFELLPSAECADDNILIIGNNDLVGAADGNSLEIIADKQTAIVQLDGNDPAPKLVARGSNAGGLAKYAQQTGVSITSGLQQEIVSYKAQLNISYELITPVTLIKVAPSTNP